MVQFRIQPDSEIPPQLNYLTKSGLRSHPGNLHPDIACLVRDRWQCKLDSTAILLAKYTVS
jgi:hypothetical protein